MATPLGAVESGIRTFRALQHRNFRLFLTGQVISVIGTWMQTVAMQWLVYRLTGSSVLLGLIAFSTQLPTLIFAPFAGVLIDRLEKRRVIVCTQTIAMLQAAALAALYFSGAIQVWHVMALSVVLGLVNAFDIPGRQSFMIEMVDDRSHLPNAIALNSSMFNLAQLVGPVIAGFTIRYASEGVCFVLNAASFLSVIVALLAMRVTPRPRNGEQSHMIRDLREGAVRAFGSGPIRSLLMFLFAMSFCNGWRAVSLPVFAKAVFHGTSQTFSTMVAAIAVGAIVAAMTLASRSSVRGLTRVLVMAGLVFGCATMLVGAAPNLYVILPLLTFTGFGAMTHMASTNTLVQTIVDDEFRGRVMAFYMMSFTGAMPLGSLAAGFATSQYGPHWTVAGFGLLAVVGTLLFVRALPKIRMSLREIYREKGVAMA